MSKTKLVVSEAIRQRSMARLAVVQALYQMEIAQTDLNQVMTEFDDLTMNRIVNEADEVELIRPDTRFFRDLVFGVVKNQESIDPAINEALAQGWKLDRLDATLRAVLRAGAYELKHRLDVPAKATITEYLDIARAFFDGPEPRVVNGVLDALAKKWQRGNLTTPGAETSGHGD